MTRAAHKTASLALAAVAVIGLSGCQAGQGAQTSQAYNPVDGRNINKPEDASFGDPYMAVRNAAVVARDGAGTLVVTILNKTESADELASVTLGGQALRVSTQPLVLDTGSSVSLGFGDNPTATTSKLDAQVGDWATLELTFVTAGIITLDVLILPYGDIYEPVSFGDRNSLEPDVARQPELTTG